MSKKMKHIETECSDWELQRSLEWKLEDAEKAGLSKLAKACRKALKQMRKAGFICVCKECDPDPEPEDVPTGVVHWVPLGTEVPMWPIGYVSEELGLGFDDAEKIVACDGIKEPEIKFSFMQDIDPRTWGIETESRENPFLDRELLDKALNDPTVGSIFIRKWS